ncbi:MAG: 30S ribosomal protein S20 [Clostridiales bacterium]|nr:30S ribosomal protein S20 [Clostridiales bacterium]
MPNIKSAKKRVLVNEKKNERNRMLTSELRTAIKKFNTAIETNNLEVAEQLLPETISVIDKAATKGIITKSSADNRKARLSKKLSDIKSGKKEVVIKKDNKTIAAEKRAEKVAREEAAKAEAKRLAEEKKAAAKEEEEKKPKTKRATKKAEKAEPEKAEAKPKRTRAKKTEE